MVLPSQIFFYLSLNWDKHFSEILGWNLKTVQLFFFSAMFKCPLSHPFAINNGASCCEKGLKKELPPDCTGSLTGFLYPDTCCLSQVVNCSEAMCNSNKAGQ